MRAQLIIRIFDVQTDERGYEKRTNEIPLLDTQVEVSPEGYQKLIKLATLALGGEIASA